MTEIYPETAYAYMKEPFSRVYDICIAYQHGVATGRLGDPSDMTPYEDPDLREAWGYGWVDGKTQRKLNKLNLKGKEG